MIRLYCTRTGPSSCSITVRLCAPLAGLTPRWVICLDVLHFFCNAGMPYGLRNGSFRKSSHVLINPLQDDMALRPTPCGPGEISASVRLAPSSAVACVNLEPLPERARERLRELLDVAQHDVTGEGVTIKVLVNGNSVCAERD